MKKDLVIEGKTVEADEDVEDEVFSSDTDLYWASSSCKLVFVFNPSLQRILNFRQLLKFV